MTNHLVLYQELYSNSITEILREGSPSPPPHVSHVICHISYVTCFSSSFSLIWWSQLLEGLLSTGHNPFRYRKSPPKKKLVLHSHCSKIIVLWPTSHKAYHKISWFRERAYGYVSSGRELALSCVTFSKSLDGCCDQMWRKTTVFSTDYGKSFLLNY